MPRPPRMPYSNGSTGPGTPPRHRFPNPSSSNYKQKKDYYPNSNDSSYPVNPTKEGFAALSSSLQNSIGNSTNKAWSFSGSTPAPTDPHPTNNVNVNHSSPLTLTPSHANPHSYDRNSMNYHSNSNNPGVNSGSNGRQQYTNHFAQKGSAPRLDSMNSSHYENNTPRRYLNGNTESYPNATNGVLKTSVYEDTPPSSHSHGRRPISEGGSNVRNQVHAPGQWSDQREMRPNSSQSRPERSLEVNQVGRNWVAKQKAAMVAVSMSPDVLLRNYRSLECSVCYNHFGFQARNQPSPVNLFCSVACLNGIPVQFPQRYPCDEQVQRPFEAGYGQDYSGRNYGPQGHGGGGDNSAERSGSVPWSPPPVSSVGPPIRADQRASIPVARNAPGSTERKAGHGHGENRQKVSNGTGQGQRVEGSGGSQNAARGGQGGPRSQPRVNPVNRSGESPFIAADDDLGLMITSPTLETDDDAVDNKLETPKACDLRAICTEVVAQAKPQHNPKPREVKQAVPPTKDVSVEVVTQPKAQLNPKPKEVKQPVLPTKAADVEAKAAGETISSLPKLDPHRHMKKLVPPNPEDIKTVHVYPNELLYNLSPKLGWSYFPVQEPSVANRTHANSATDFFVQTFAIHNSSLAMAEHIYAHVEQTKDKPQFLEDPKLYDICLAPYADEYYRGEIIEMLPPERVKIFFSDFGNTEEVFTRSLLELPPTLALEPRLIINCQWDMALTDEFCEANAKHIIEDDVAPITATHKLADGQFIVKLEQFTPYSKFVVHHAPKGAKGSEGVPNATPSANRPAPNDPPKAEQPSTQTKVTSAPPRNTVPQPVQPEPVVPRPAAAAAAPEQKAPARGFPECTPTKGAPSVEAVASKTTPLAEILAAPKPIVPRVAPARPAPAAEETVPLKPRVAPARPAPAAEETVALKPRVAPARPAPAAEETVPLKPRMAPVRPAPVAVETVPIPPKKPDRKKYMLTQLPLTKNIQPNGDVRVAFCFNMTRYFVTGDNDGTDAYVVQSLIGTHLPNCKGLEGDLPVVGEVLLGDYGDEEYYRAVVTDVDVENETAIVEFIDFGDSARNKFEKLRIPNEEIMKHPVYGMVVHLELMHPTPPAEVISENPAELTSLFLKPMQIEFPVGQFQPNARVWLWMNSNESLNDLVDEYFQRYATKGRF